MDFKAVWQYYKGIRFRNLASPKYRHVLLNLYWAVYGPTFLFVERFWPTVYHHFTGKELEFVNMWCKLDDMIPFCEFFVIPYYFWFVFLVGFGAYSLLFDIPAFRRFTWMVITTYSVAMIVSFLVPTRQMLRPSDFPRDNFFTDIVKGLYEFDTNTNVCPSVHVLGALAVCMPGLHSKTLRGWGWKVFFVVSTILISLSTVFMKQHSILDVFAALAVGAACYVAVFFVICRGDEPGNKKEKAIPDAPEEVAEGAAPPEAESARG